MGPIISKIVEKKEEKKAKLLDSAYHLFTKNGINNTSVQDIVDDAGVAKGTFYLYYKDKYNLQDELIIEKSREVFREALSSLQKSFINNFEDQIIFIINYVIDILNKDKTLVKFISKDLSLGVYTDSVSNLLGREDIGVQEVFMSGIKKNNLQMKNPEVVLFMIIELVSSTVFTSIIKDQPLPITKYKPFLYDTIRTMLRQSKRA